MPKRYKADFGTDRPGDWGQGTQSPIRAKLELRGKSARSPEQGKDRAWGLDSERASPGRLSRGHRQRPWKAKKKRWEL